ncbi:MAG: hypothetical protein ACOX3T_05510 [Bdellovibrionota bacterium]
MIKKNFIASLCITLFFLGFATTFANDVAMFGVNVEETSSPTTCRQSEPNASTTSADTANANTKESLRLGEAVFGFKPRRLSLGAMPDASLSSSSPLSSTFSSSTSLNEDALGSPKNLWTKEAKEFADKCGFSSKLTPYVESGSTKEILPLTEKLRRKYTTQFEKESETVIYSTSDGSFLKKATPIDKLNTFSKDVFTHNFLMNYQRGSSAVSMLPALAFIKSSGKIEVVNSVNKYLSLGTNDFYSSFIPRISEYVAIETKIISDEAQGSSNKIAGLEFVSLSEANAEFKRLFNITKDVFSSTSKTQGYSTIYAGRVWDKRFDKLEEICLFYNQDGTVSKTHYVVGEVLGCFSDDRETLKIDVSKEFGKGRKVEFFITKDFLSKNEKSFSDELKTIRIALPALQLRNIVSLQDFEVNGHTRAIRAPLQGKLGNFYFLTNFQINEYGVYLGEDLIFDEPSKASTNKLKVDDINDCLCISSSFKVEWRVNDVLVYAAVTDGGETFILEKLF